MTGRHYRGRRNRKSGVIRMLAVFLMLGVFCFCAFRLFRILGGYLQGQKEYDRIRDLVLSGYDDGSTGDDTGAGGFDDGFRVDFQTLSDINPDTVGWIRFYPEPEEINYPLVQADNNELYLSKTFSANENTVGAIFVSCYNRADFNDRNTIIYGHHMKDNSMFHQLEKYEDYEFWEENPYFFIYTPDGRKIIYHIYSCGVVNELSDSYKTVFEDDKEFEAFLEETEAAGNYATHVEVKVTDQVVTLSTCTKESDDNRMVVRGVKVSEKKVQ